MKITRNSPLSGKTNVMDLDVTWDQLADWRNGTLIQDAMPNLTSDEREFLISGMTPEEWEQLFGEDK